MTDPIKQFVEQNRADFDHMEPPADALQQIMNRLKAKAAEEKKAEEKKIVPLYSRTKWLVAASVLLAITTTYVLFHKVNSNIVSNQLVQQSTKKTDQNTAIESNPVPQKKQEPVLVKTLPSPVSVKTIKTVKNPVRVNDIPASVNIVSKDMYAGLADSSSASVRLSAILDIDRASKMNQNILDRLAESLNHDSNSNVRLAALNVMGQYANDEYASSLLVKSLATQNDPLVQFGLIAILGKLDNVKIEDRLFALAEDPNTFGAVKDEAYGVLLNQNKL